MIYPELCRVYLYSVDLQARLITTRSLINSFHRRWLPLGHVHAHLPKIRFTLCCVDWPQQDEFSGNPTVLKEQWKMVSVCERRQKPPLLCGGKAKLTQQRFSKIVLLWIVATFFEGKWTGFFFNIVGFIGGMTLLVVNYTQTHTQQCVQSGIEVLFLVLCRSARGSQGVSLFHLIARA